MMSLQEFKARQVATCSSSTHHAAGQQSKRKVEFEPLSTTALILEDRPPYDYFLSLYFLSLYHLLVSSHCVCV